MTTCAFLSPWLLPPICLLIALSTGELEFYRDTGPEAPQSLALRQFARYLDEDAGGPGDAGLRLERLSPFLAPRASKKLERGRQRDVLRRMGEKSRLVEGAWPYRVQAQYGEPIEEDPLPEENYEPPYYDGETIDEELRYPDLELPYLSGNLEEDVGGIFEDAYPLDRPPSRYEGAAAKEKLSLEAREKYEETRNEDLTVARGQIPEFTFHFDEEKPREERPFAVNPADPRYYQNAPFYLEEKEEPEEQRLRRNDTKEERGVGESEGGGGESEGMERGGSESEDGMLENPSTDAMAEVGGRTSYHPLAVPLKHDLNNDIYFIAIVAGCSAAAMFALVLISLTWCRLQRNVKAAADIEYPAYGITGPNKDVSPSGDQRLAQSAQMYHFQHQKQQIIAMENRTSATRDPGSVSEAESDEENEEGDYTVYECPGLASTGEMEVKNPLFHDDPTPATPAQTNKEEDHI
ncbi:hypothetical protein KM043_010569 [Ampulex compressa]|nr:hypothetical protein KM043_010569 [Ampulex compressa]